MQFTIDTLTANAEIVERLARSFGLRIGADAADPKWFSIDGIEDFQPIGRDSTGGAFVELPGSQRVLYVSSEGQAGIIAANLTEFITMIVACPYWHDVLKFSGKGSLHEMRRAATALEATMDDDDDLDEARDYLKSQLGLVEPTDPVAALHLAVSTSNVVVRPDGNPCRSLFNVFTVDDNPMLRGFAG